MRPVESDERLSRIETQRTLLVRAHASAGEAREVRDRLLIRYTGAVSGTAGRCW